MKALRMGSGLIEEHNAQFKMAVTKSKLDSSSPAVIDYYRESPSNDEFFCLRIHPKPYKSGTTGQQTR